MSLEMKYFEESVLPKLEDVNDVKKELQRMFKFHNDDLTFNQKQELLSLGVSKIKEIIKSGSSLNIFLSRLEFVIGKKQEDGRTQTITLLIREKDVTSLSGEILDGSLDQKPKLVIQRHRSALLPSDY